jgi:hypothetical protein
VKSTRNRWIAIGVTLVVVLGVAFALARRGGDHFPDSVVGLQRVHSADAQGLQKQVSTMGLGNVKAKAAVYGVGDITQISVVIYSGFPAPPDPTNMLKGASSGIIASGGSMDLTNTTSLSRAGIQYVCAPFHAKLYASSTAPSDGQACVWTGGKDVGLVMTITTTDGNTAATQAADIHDAVA